MEATIDGIPKHRWVSGGVSAQLALTERVAVAVNALVRKAEYNTSREDLAGVDNPNTPEDDRTLSTIDDWGRLRYLDVPVLARVYGKRRHQSGDRWFVEFGPSLRTVRKVKNTITTTVGEADPVKADGPAAAFRRNVAGATAGFGLQFIDPVGVRVVPEVRYTRWLGSSINNPGIHSNRHQLEVMFSLTF